MFYLRILLHRVSDCFVNRTHVDAELFEPCRDHDVVGAFFLGEAEAEEVLFLYPFAGMLWVD